MEQITKRDGLLFYGEQRCVDIEDAYKRFRRDYHRSLGREVSNRLDRLGRREERIHGYGFVFSEPINPKEIFLGHGRICYTLQLVNICYCRIFGCWSYAHVREEDFEHWLDWALSKGSGVMRLVGRKDKSGRTGKRLKTRYR